MKITKKDYERLEAAILAKKEEHKIELKNYHSHGLSSMRYRWDIFNTINFELVRDLYIYLNDSHIDTALRKITNTTSKRGN